VAVGLEDGRTLSATGHDFTGAPSNPKSPAGLDEKFLSLSSGLGGDRNMDLLAKLRCFGEQDDVCGLFVT
jgi:hypothetical protein